MSNLNGVNNHNGRPFPGTPPTTIIRPTTQPPPAAGMPGIHPLPVAIALEDGMTNVNDQFIPQGPPTIRPQIAGGQTAAPVPPMPRETVRLNIPAVQFIHQRLAAITEEITQQIPTDMARQTLQAMIQQIPTDMVQQQILAEMTQEIPADIAQQIIRELIQQMLETVTVIAANAVLENTHPNNHLPTLPIHEQTDPFENIPATVRPNIPAVQFIHQRLAAITEEITQQIPTDMARQTLQAMLQQIPVDMAQQILPEMTQEIPADIAQQIIRELLQQILETVTVIAANAVLENTHPNNHLPTLPIHEQIDPFENIPNPETTSMEPIPPADSLPPTIPENHERGGCS